MSDVIEKIVDGDVRTVSRFIRDIDDGIPYVRDILKKLHAFTGNAYVIGVTGSPGVGKSTLVNQMISHLRKREKTVGVLAVDPTSPFSGGAILGDRVRMQQHSTDNDVFIRSMATRGYFGGLTQSIGSAIDVLDAMGKDYIIIETVGVGQDEVDIAKSAHTTVIVVIPGMGDDIQAIKAGLLEAGDIFAINKVDREGAEKTFSYLKMMIDLDQKGSKEGMWTPSILKVEAIHDKGVFELLEEIEKHRKFIDSTNIDIDITIKKKKIRHKLTDMVKNRLVHEVLNQLAKSDDFEKAVNFIAEGKVDPYTACDNLVLSKLNPSK